MKRKNLRQVYAFLRVIKKLPPDDRKIILRYLNDNGCDIIYETIHNSLWNTGVPQQKRLRLKKLLIGEKNTLRMLGKATKNTPKKQSKLIQAGGSTLSTILETVLPILAAILI